MRKASLTLLLGALLFSLLLLSVLSSILAGYPERPRESGSEKKGIPREKVEEPSILLFKVSPVKPQLFWRMFSADYYTGVNWLRSTEEEVLEEKFQIQNVNATKIFTVEINFSQQEIFLPVASANSTLKDISYVPSEGLKFKVDGLGNVFRVAKDGLVSVVPLVYNVSWSNVEVEDELVELDNVPEGILDKYLQLPNLPTEVLRIAEGLKVPSYSVLDQVLANVQYLKTEFVYDLNQQNLNSRTRTVYERIQQGCDVSSYIKWKTGVCIDAATALAVFLRVQGIPARISVGYKPERVEGNKLLFYTTGSHAVTEVYLPPYGWVQFDATPPTGEGPLVRTVPFKKESPVGSTVFFKLSVTNRHNFTDDYKMLVNSNQGWKVEVAPKKLTIEAFETLDALLEVTLPIDAELNQKTVITVTAASQSRLGISFSSVAIVEVEDVPYVPTTTTLAETNETVVRGSSFWTNGTVFTASEELVDDDAIFVYLTKKGKAEGVIVGKGFTKHGSFHVKSVAPHFAETGEHKVILVSLGTTQYAPSSVNITMEVWATTTMKLCKEEDFLLGYGTIHGRLSWDNGSGIAYVPISLEVSSYANSSNVWTLENSTFEDGSFKFEVKFEHPGIYEVKATFYGRKSVFGSNATRTIELKRGTPSVHIVAEAVAVRGEVFNVTGKIGFENFGVWGETVTVAFDDQWVSTVDTGENGSFTLHFLVDAEEDLGRHVFAVTLEEDDISAFHEVTVKSKTNLTTKISEVAGGMFLLFSTSLSDDRDLPIGGGEIHVIDYGLSGETDKYGNLAFLLENVRFWPENITLTAKFETSELYLPAALEQTVVLGPVTSLAFLLPLAFPAAAIMSFASAKSYLEKRRARVRLETAADAKLMGPHLIVEETMSDSQDLRPLEIVFVDIGAQFPNVWALNDELHVEIVLRKDAGTAERRSVEVFVDEETVASVKLSRRGLGIFSFRFVDVGEHAIKAILPRESKDESWIAEKKLRVVDYGEEIVRLYSKFLEALTNRDVLIRAEMTAREIEGLVSKMDGISQVALGNVTATFEKAEYSNHSATRKDYEVMILSLKELNVEVEQKE